MKALSLKETKVLVTFPVADKCQNCHIASPFLNTLAIDQLTNPVNPAEPLVPFTGNNPYSINGQ